MILVDSTVWIDLLRRTHTAPAAMLERLLGLGEAAVAPVIVQEILQGASSQRIGTEGVPWERGWVPDLSIPGIFCPPRVGRARFSRRSRRRRCG